MNLRLSANIGRLGRSLIMQSAYISYRSSLLHYVYAGAGNKIVFCFHGYGEQGHDFSFLEKYTGTDFTFYAIDLPFHGKTEWKEGLNFTIPDLKAIIEIILEQSNPEPMTIKDKYILMGFSLGGRIALSLYGAIPGQVEKLVLLAPDGLKVNFWYWMATQTWLGNHFFAFTMKHPGWFLEFLRVLNNLNLVNASIIKFVNYYIGDKEVRRLLYERWTALRKLKPGAGRIRSFIIKYRTSVRLIYGKHDRIILSSVGERFQKGIEEFCSLTVIESGHQVLHENHAAEIVPLLLD
jgi:pimeloyl-ACP methyl ester carboxylesterase